MVKMNALPPSPAHHPRWEELEPILARTGAHVDHARVGVGVDLEEELAEAVDYLVPAVDELQLAGELGRPFGQVVDVGEQGWPWKESHTPVPVPGTGTWPPVTGPPPPDYGDCAGVVTES
jgi:hypothetical protein